MVKQLVFLTIKKTGTLTPDISFILDFTYDPTISKSIMSRKYNSLKC